MTSTPSQSVTVPETVQLIDGEWSPAPVDLGIDLENPNTAEKVARMKGSTDEDVETDAALGLADTAQTQGGALAGVVE